MSITRYVPPHKYNLFIHRNYIMEYDDRSLLRQLYVKQTITQIIE